MSFEALVKKISPTLKRITYRLNGHFSFFNDEDLFQEALVHLWGEFSSGRLSDKSDSYILQGCYFHLKNYIRKAKEKAKLLSLDMFLNHDENGNFPEALLLEDENSRYFRDYLDNKLLVEAIQNNGLTKREKEVLSLCLENLTTREMGIRLGISHVRVVKIRAGVRKKLKYLLDKNNTIC